MTVVLNLVQCVTRCPTLYRPPGFPAVGQACSGVSRAWTLVTGEGGAAPQQAQLKWR